MHLMQYGTAIMAVALTWNAQAMVIDQFVATQSIAITQAAPKTVNDVIDDASALGGWRNLWVNKISGGPGYANATFVEVNIDANETFQVSNGNNTDSTVRIDWNGNGAGLGGVDITDAGAAQGFLLHILFADLGATFRFDAWSAAGTSSATVQVAADVTSPALLYAPFADFVGAADFQSLSALRLTIDGPKAWQLTFDSILTSPLPVMPDAVPEPALLALLGLGVLALAWVRWLTSRPDPTQRNVAKLNSDGA